MGNDTMCQACYLAMPMGDWPSLVDLSAKLLCLFNTVMGMLLKISL